GRPLDAAIPAEIAVVPVAILLAVRLVVLLVVADEIGEGEPVMGGDEVDAGPGATPGMAEDVGGAGEARGEVGDDPFIALPEAPDRVAILRVPLRPARREAAELVAVGAGVPWLGDELYLREHRVLAYRFEKGACRREAVADAAQGRCQIEAK